MKILLKEHEWNKIVASSVEDPVQPLQIPHDAFAKISKDNVRLFKKERGKAIYPFLLHQNDTQSFSLQANYYVGVDWLIPGMRYVQVDPKINKKGAIKFDQATEVVDDDVDANSEEHQETKADSRTEDVEIDYLRMLLDLLSEGLPERYTCNLALIDWQANRIPIDQKDDRLTPFLIVQFLQLLKTIVRKGLKKSYYKVQENLTNKVKGKILVGTHVRKNVLKSRLTQTYCEYQVFGENNIENRFLKKVFCFASSYIANNKTFFGTNNFELIEQLMNYSRPALEHIGDEMNENQLKEVRHNPFFKEYKEAITIGKHILKRFAYNITETSNQKQTTPPFWIDMPKLFELHCYSQILKANLDSRAHIHYQFTTYGNELDILISKPECQMVIDVKYKMKYETGQIHEDIRQVSGYARLKKVRHQLGIADDSHIDCLIIYPNATAPELNHDLHDLLKTSRPISAYHRIYKLGVSFPIVDNREQ